MWIYIEHDNNCLNMDHAARLYVESTGAGAALKMDIAGKTFMVRYYESKTEAQDGLAEIMRLREAGASVVRLTKK